jgi:hypothetical protein
VADGRWLAVEEAQSVRAAASDPMLMTTFAWAVPDVIAAEPPMHAAVRPGWSLYSSGSRGAGRPQRILRIDDARQRPCADVARREGPAGVQLLEPGNPSLRLLRRGSMLGAAPPPTENTDGSV